MKKGNVFIGTSGWKYAHWESLFYPPKLKKKDQLSYFASRFRTVELNNSFYRQPKPENFLDWGQQVPEGFIYAVKANRYFTHLKKLKVSKRELGIFMDAAANLGDHLGPVLFQLPPRWKVNLERLENFLNILPNFGRYAIEFRDQSWYIDEVYVLLEKYNCAFCIYDLGGHQSPIIERADFLYIRLHGPGEKYQGSYDGSILETWAGKVRDWLVAGKDVYLYFDNDQSAFATENADSIIEMLKI